MKGFTQTFNIQEIPTSTSTNNNTTKTNSKRNTSTVTTTTTTSNKKSRILTKSNSFNSTSSNDDDEHSDILMEDALHSSQTKKNKITILKGKRKEGGGEGREELEKEENESKQVFKKSKGWEYGDGFKVDNAISSSSSIKKNNTILKNQISTNKRKEINSTSTSTSTKIRMEPIASTSILPSTSTATSHKSNQTRKLPTQSNTPPGSPRNQLEDVTPKPKSRQIPPSTKPLLPVPIPPILTPQKKSLTSKKSSSSPETIKKIRTPTLPINYSPSSLYSQKILRQHLIPPITKRPGMVLTTAGEEIEVTFNFNQTMIDLSGRSGEKGNVKRGIEDGTIGVIGRDHKKGKGKEVAVVGIEKKITKRIKKEKVGLKEKEPELYKRLKEVNWNEVDPNVTKSLLFTIEYLNHGDLEYNQSYRKPFKKKKKVGNLDEIEKRIRILSWERLVDTRILARRLEEEEFITPIWGKHLISFEVKIISREEEEEEGKEKEEELERIRKIEIKGVEMYLIGKEFPLRYIMLVGIVIGVTVKTPEGGLSKVTYSIDDGTAVIECQSQDQEFVEVNIKVGMLVRVTGSLFKEFFDPLVFRVQINKIAELRDSNLECKHHLLVDKLCKEVYNQDLDLESKLSAMRSQEKEWEGSQAPSSEAGTPKKPKPLMKAKRLDPEDLQANFLPYIKHFLRSNHLDIIDNTSPPSSNTFNPLINSFRSPPIELPIEFTLSDLESSELLKDFAELLVQKLEKDRLSRLGKKNIIVEKPASWNAKLPEGNIYRSNPPGWVKSGSRVLLGPNSRKLSKGKGKDGNTSRGGGGSDESNRSMEEILNDKPLKGERLETAIHLLFRKALIELRTLGHIVLSIPEELEQLEAIANQDDTADFILNSFNLEPHSPVRFDPYRINNSTYNSTSISNPFNGSNLNHFILPSVPETVRNPWDLVVNRSDKPPPIHPCDINKMEYVRNSEGGWELTPKSNTFYGLSNPIINASDNDTPTRNSTLLFPQFDQSNQYNQFNNPSDVPSSGNKSSRSFILPTSSPIKNESEKIIRSKKGSNDSRTDSIYAIDMEAWILVTPALLNQPLLKIIEAEGNVSRVKNKKGGGGGGSTREAEGISERLLKEMLLNDARWESVAKNNMLLQDGIKDLIERNKIIRDGQYLIPVVKY